MGHLIKVLEKEYFPADAVLLCSSNMRGICCIETKNLDGENNIKSMQVHGAMQRLFKHNFEANASFISNLRFIYERPSQLMHKFSGYFLNE